MKTTAARNFLNASGVFWFSTVLVGQIIFVWFILSKYGGSALQGNAQEVWNKELTHGYVPGMVTSNLAVLIHLLFAAVITASGLLQLTPQIRNNFRAFHRWNGRM